jgi:hypothetical protein
MPPLTLATGVDISHISIGRVLDELSSIEPNEAFTGYTERLAQIDALDVFPDDPEELLHEDFPNPVEVTGF